MVIVEVGILLILPEVSYQELSAVAGFCRAESLRCHRALAAVALLEEATVGGLTRPSHSCMENEVDARLSSFATVSAGVPVDVTRGPLRLLNATQVPQVLRCARDSFLLEHQAAI